MGHHPAGGDAAGGQPGDVSDTEHKPLDQVDWDGIFAFVVHALGWTWEAAEAQLDLHRLRALNRHWRQHPPVHLLVARYLDYQPPPPPLRPGEEATGELAQLLATMPVQASAPALDTAAWNAARKGDGPVH